MNSCIHGIHHVTAITADAQANVDFYSGVLGLRLVKLTVNFDDPSSYHLYYGDELGRPGTIITFFAWPGARRGRIGPPQVAATAFAAPGDSLDFWTSRLAEVGANPRRIERFGQPLVTFADPDGLPLEIVGAAPGGGQPDAAPGHGLRCFHGVSLALESCEHTGALLTGTMGFALEGQVGARFRYRGGGDVARVVDLVCAPDGPPGRLGAGVVHHVAFRVADEQRQREFLAQLARDGRNVSPVMDRRYFRSIYFREPGGVLFEVATDVPGMAIDEEPASLGTSLKLPPWLETDRARIEQSLPPLRLPTWVARAP